MFIVTPVDVGAFAITFVIGPYKGQHVNCDLHLQSTRYIMCLTQALEMLPAKQDEHVGYNPWMLQGPITITLKCFINNEIQLFVRLLQD